jgi:hypothetical protein
VSPDSGVFNSGTFESSPYLGDAINSAICQSEIYGGVELSDLAPGAVVEVITRHRTYVLENRGNGDVLISGHPMYCPEPVLVRFHGSTWGTPMIRPRFIGREMKMEFCHPSFGVVHTSRVTDIRELPTGGPRHA